MTNTNDTVILIGPQPPTESTGGAGGSSWPYSQWRSGERGEGGIIYTNITIVGGRGGDYIENNGVSSFDMMHFGLTLVTFVLVFYLVFIKPYPAFEEEEEENNDAKNN